MTASRVGGLSATQALFESMGGDARDDMRELLAEIAVDALAVQKEKTPEDTGALEAGLSTQVLANQLRARMGLLGLTGGRAKLFYGRPVDRGIAPQVVLVQRRRRVAGRLRSARGRKVASDIVATYALHVKARPGVGFIEAPDLAAIADGRLDAFWQRLEAAGDALA